MAKKTQEEVVVDTTPRPSYSPFIGTRYKLYDSIFVANPMLDEIKCSIVPLKSRSNDTENQEFRYGRYDNSMHRDVDYGRKKWAVAMRIKVKWSEYIMQNYPQHEIIKRCMKFLFTKPIKQKTRGNNYKDIYPFGNIDPEPITYTFNRDGDAEYVTLMFYTDTNECNLYWGEPYKW